MENEKKTLIFIVPEYDDASGIFTENGELVYTFDTYHNGMPDIELLEALGYKVIIEYFRDYIEDSEIEDTDRSDEIPNLELLKERIKEKHGNGS